MSRPTSTVPPGPGGVSRDPDARSVPAAAARPAGAVVWIALGALALAFVVLAVQFRWFNDDTFITFRYSWNLAHGHGFVWNAGGPPVEGSTSMGWTLLNALGMLVGADPVLLSWTVGIAAGVLGLVLCFLAARRHLGLAPAWALLAPAFLFAGRQWVIGAVGANETRAATVTVFAATLLMAAEQLRVPPGWAGSGALFFLGTLLRPETPLLHLAAGLGFAIARPTRERLVAIAKSGALHGALLGALVLVRLAYFGHPLPNTFYAKVGGLQFALGLRYLAEFPASTFGWLWGPVLLFGLFVLTRRLPDLGAALLVQSVLLATWVAAVGGDAWEFRFLDAALPGLALLVAAAIVALLQLKADLPTPRRALAFAALGVALAGTQAATTFLPFPRGSGDGDGNAPVRRDNPLVSSGEMKGAAEVMLGEGQALARWLAPGDRICTGWAGAVPYITHAWHLDPWGLNDAEIARRPFDPQAVLFHQRHATWKDVVDSRVMFCDAYNQFLFDRPYPPNAVPHPAMPWIDDGVMIYCVRLPQRQNLFWIFASPRPREEIEAWVRGKGLQLVYSQPIAFRAPATPPSMHTP